MSDTDVLLNGSAISKEYIRKSSGTNIFFAVKDADLKLCSGKVTLVSGRSGSGKTTLLHIMAGILAPTTGTVSFAGEDIYKKSDDELARFRNLNFGIIPQGQSAIGSLTVMENVLLPYSLYNESPDRADEAKELLERLGIAALSDVMPKELSGGELRRMAIARALIRHPKVIFADEPTGDLDDANTEEVFSLLRQEASGGACVFLVTHEPGAERFADDVFRMDAGVLKKP